MKNKVSLCILILSIIIISCVQEKDKKKVLVENKKPNIIYILDDDMGIGDLGTYGQTKIQTPNVAASYPEIVDELKKVMKNESSASELFPFK